MSKNNGIKIGSKEEVLWTKVKQECKVEIEQSENTIKIDKELLKIAENKILLEKRK